MDKPYLHEMGSFLLAPELGETGQPATARIKEGFSKIFKGDIQLKRRFKYTNGSGCFMYCSICKKDFKLTYSTQEAEKGNELNVKVFAKDNDICNCRAKIQIRGDDRVAMGKKLEFQTPFQVRRDFFTQPVGITQPVPPSLLAIKKVAQEGRRRDELDQDPILDVMKRYQSDQLSNVIEISVYTLKKIKHFRMILTSDHANLVLERFLLNKDRMPFKRLLLDATGKVTAPVFGKPLLHHVLLAPIQKNRSEVCFLVPVGEMVTDDQTGKNIGHFIHLILDRVSTVAFKRLRQIGTDDSWANVHAIFSLTPGMTVIKYLHLCYEVFLGKEPSAELLVCIAVAYCFSHFNKNWKMDCIAAFGKEQVELRSSVRAVLTEMTLMDDPRHLLKYIRAFLILLLSKFNCDELKQARMILGTPKESNDMEEDDEGDPVGEVLLEPMGKAMYKNSPFYILFHTDAENLKHNLPQIGKEPNPFFSETLAKKLIEHYFAYLPMWTIFISRLQHSTAERSNNARVERHFLSLKNDCEQEQKLTRLGSIKVGCYAEFRGRCLNAQLNEIDLEAAEFDARSFMKMMRKAEAVDYDDDADLSQRKEQWSKHRRSKYADLSRKNLMTEFGGESLASTMKKKRAKKVVPK